MSEELVSALLDGECSPTEVRRLLDQTPDSEHLMQQWSRMSLVRDVLAGKSVQSSAKRNADDFCAGIMANLGEMEPAAQAKHVPMPSKVVALPSRSRPAVAQPQRRRRSRPLIGWAAAASVTMVALAGGRAWLVGNNTSSAPQLAVATASIDSSSVDADSSSGNVRPVADVVGSNRGGLVPVSTRSYSANAEEPAETRWAQLDPAAARELNAYMIEHNNSRADQGMNGALGYARLAARNVEYRSSNEPH